MSRQDTRSTPEQLMGKYRAGLRKHAPTQNKHNNHRISKPTFTILNPHNSTLQNCQILNTPTLVNCVASTLLKKFQFNWLSSKIQRGSVSLHFPFGGFSTFQIILCTCRYLGVYLDTWVLGCLGMYLGYLGMYLGTWVLGCLGMYLGCCRSYHETSWLPPKLPYFKCHSTETTFTFSNTQPSWYIKL